MRTIPGVGRETVQRSRPLARGAALLLTVALLGCYGQAQECVELGAAPWAAPAPLAGEACASGTIGRPGLPALFDVRLPSPGGASSVTATLQEDTSGAGLELCLLDADGGRLQCRFGIGTVSLHDLLPPDGAYLVQLRHEGPDGVAFRITSSVAQAAGDEREPNDDLPQASPLVGGEARGRFVGDETDFYVFEVEGEPRLWRFQAEGSGLGGLGYLDGSGSEVLRASADSSGESVAMSNLFLLPGRHYLYVRGEDGEYLLRATPLGAADDASEREANDDPTRALPLAFQRERAGILDSYDRDVYRFSLFAQEYVRLEVSPSPGLSVRLRVGEFSGDYGRGEPVVYEGLLLPGDHYVEIRPDGESSGSYTVLLTPLDPLALPADVEPNDQHFQARPFPASGVIEGRLGRNDQRDWYLLPPLAEPRRLLLTAEGGADLVFYRLTGGSVHQVARMPATEGELEVELPAGEDLRLSVGGAAPYRVTFGAEWSSPRADRDLRLELEGPGLPAAAYWHEGQLLQAAVLLANDGPEERTVALEMASSHYGWKPQAQLNEITLAPGESRRVPLTVEVLPDARDDLPTRVSVRARTAAGYGPSATVALEARCGAEPVAPSRLWSLPTPMLGGVNLAWAGMGGQIAGGQGGGQPNLIDGMVAPSTGWAGQVGGGVTILLVNAQAPLVGVLLNPYSHRTVDERLADFELLASDDGETFQPVLRARLSPVAIEQAFLFERPLRARFLRLVALSNQRGDNGIASLGEMKVVAAPDVDLTGQRGANLAEPATGGYVAWSRPSFPHATGTFGEQAEPRYLYLEKDETVIEWALGFHNNRAARLSALEWVASPPEDGHPAIETVEVAVSAAGPAGPWIELGTWQAATQPVLTFADQPWARFVRLRATGLEEGKSYRLPQDVRVREAPVAGEYRTILGEWGQSRREAAFEALVPAEPAVVISEHDDNDSRERAQPLIPGEAIEGRVVVGEDVDWYRIVIPEGENSIELTLAGEPVLSVRYQLLDGRGQPVPYDVSGSLARVTVTAFVEPGEYFLRLEEPPRSVVFAWDNSGSMGEYLDIIYQTVSGFVRDVQPGREAAQLLAFEEDPRGVFLLPEWSDDPLALMTALNEYDRSAGSSNAEANLLAATRVLGERSGTRAVLFMTDAETNGQDLTGELWTELERVRPRIFTFETSSAGSMHTQDLMQAWADVSGGYYDYARGVGDFEAGFARATCHLRRPAPYRLEAATAFREPPGPGLLSVVREAGVAGNPPVEVILDLSGSMAKALPEGPSRVEVAKRVLSGLVEEVLPEGTPFALRLFGHIQPNSCDTRLEMRLAPLDREATRRVITLAQPQLLSGTPLAASLLEVPADLEGREGATVILLTDGEESCGGDVEAAVTALSAAGIDVRLHIISFDVESEEAKAAFADWARLGGGRFFGTSDEAGLAAALRSALAPEFEVIDGTGSVVARGTVGGPALTLPPGMYQVRVQGTGGTTFAEVRVRGDDEQQLVLGGDGR